MTRGICRGEYEEGNMSGGGNITRGICRGEYDKGNMSGRI